MDIQFKKVIGKTEFTFNVQAEGLKDFFEKVSVYEDLPTQGPNGETDLRIAFRTTKQGHKYYSVVSDQAKQEFKFGQSTDNVTMFPKGWEPLYQGDGQASSNANQGGLGQAQQQYVQNNGLGAQQAAPQQVPAPQTNYTTPAQAPTPAPTQAPQQTTTPTMNNTPAQAAPAQNNAVNDVLSKYGIGQ